MLTKFEVTNFKNFEKKLSLDLTKSNNYAFNKECVKEGIVNKALVYGHNGIGKSNLGFAIFDLITHLTDKYYDPSIFTNYLTACHKCKTAHFVYEFLFDKCNVRYEYGKTNHESLQYEKLYIDGKEYASIDREVNSIATINAFGAESLKKDLGESRISIITYIKKNSVLDDNSENKCFFDFVDFVCNMLFFRSLDSNSYIGFEQGSSALSTDIVEKGNINDFEIFLNEAGVECKLNIIDSGDKQDLAFDFNGKLIPFFDIASQGTKALTLFYYWFSRLKGSSSKVRFLFIDEFDAFYHHSLSALIVKYLRKINAQTIITTHNISIMTNDLLRPDCYFLMNNKGMHSLANSTVKDLREAHNIEKMYKAGAFNG